MREYLSKIVDEHGDIGFVRFFSYLTGFFLIALVGVIYVFLNVYSNFVIILEWYVFLIVILFLFICSVLSFCCLIDGVMQLEGTKKRETLKYTRYLQIRLEKLVPTSSITGAESYQSISARRLNLLNYQSFVIADKHGNFALFIRLSNNLDLQKIMDDRTLREISSYFARLTNTHFLDVQKLSVEQKGLLHSKVKDYAVIRLLK